MLEPHPVHLWLAGGPQSGTARVINDKPGEQLQRGMAAFRSMFAGAKATSVMVRVGVGETQHGSTGGST